MADQPLSAQKNGVEIKLSIPHSGPHGPCRICGADAAVVIRRGSWSSHRYYYCGPCVDRAMEREELRRA